MRGVNRRPMAPTEDNGVERSLSAGTRKLRVKQHTQEQLAQPWRWQERSQFRLWGKLRQWEVKCGLTVFQASDGAVVADGLQTR